MTGFIMIKSYKSFFCIVFVMFFVFMFVNFKNTYLIELSPEAVAASENKLRKKPFEQHVRSKSNSDNKSTKQETKLIENRLKLFPNLMSSKNHANSSSKCRIWKYPERVKSDENPQIVLNGNILLYPTLWGGPNNQLRGIMHAVYLAIRLNRTFVLPRVFSAHYTHPGDLSPYQIVDVEYLCQFVSCISVEEMRNKCSNSFDVAFQLSEAKPLSSTVMKNLEDITKMAISPRSLPFFIKFVSSNEKNISEIPVLPDKETLHKIKKNQVPSNASKLHALYNTTLPCASLVSVFQDVAVKLYRKAPMSLSKKAILNVETVPDNQLFSAVFNAVRHPPCIVAAAQSYIRNSLQNAKYVAVHWRYNEEDWLRCCITDPIPKWCLFICKNVNIIKPIHVAKGIVAKMQHMLKIGPVAQTILPVYIATPPSMKKFRDNIYVELLKSRFIKTFVKPTQNLTSFLRNEYETCWKETGWKITEEIESFCEMEIVKHSTWFFYSIDSTWSKNIRPWRTFAEDSTKRKFESNIFSAALFYAKSHR